METEKWMKASIPVLLFLLFLPQHAGALTGTIELTTPENETLTSANNDTLPFVFSYTDPHNATALCTLHVNGAPSGSVTAENASSTSVYSGGDFSEGKNTWRITCENTTSISSETRTFFADREPPAVVLVSPSDHGTETPGAIDFTFRYTDETADEASCSLHVNGTLEDTDGSVQNNTEETLGASLPEGYYEWMVKCNDSLENTGESAVFTLIVGEAITIEIVLPRNATYPITESMPLNFTASEAPDWAAYSLDGSPNVTISGNTTFDAGSEGQHLIELYANDSSGNLAYDHVYFTVGPSNEVVFVSPLKTTYNTDSVHVNATTDTDASWCGLSVDGGENITMQNTTGRSWSYNLSGLDEDVHHLKIWCRDPSGSLFSNSTTFSVVLSEFTIAIGKPKNETYWNTTSLDVSADVSRDAEACRFYLNSEDPVIMYNASPRLWYYGFTSIVEGTYDLTIECSDTFGISNSARVGFTVKARECESNESGLCTGTQHCAGGVCEEINCSGCSYAADHGCQPYECCENEDCLDEQECVSNACTAIECECGEIRNHECIRYECCSNFDCAANEQCNLSSHECVGRLLSIIAPDSAMAGNALQILVLDQDRSPVEGATLTIGYPSGRTETLTTDSDGLASTFAAESGTVTITAQAAGYETRSISTEVMTGINWVLVMALVLISIAAIGGVFYFTQLPGVRLKKAVSGQEVTLKIKNRGKEYMENVLIMDTVPSGAFISCGLIPKIETFGNEDHITWFAALEPKEEVEIKYKAAQTGGSFSVKIGEEEYHSGYGLTSILSELKDRIFRKKAQPQAAPVNTEYP